MNAREPEAWRDERPHASAQLVGMLGAVAYGFIVGAALVWWLK